MSEIRAGTLSMLSKSGDNYCLLLDSSQFKSNSQFNMNLLRVISTKRQLSSVKLLLSSPFIEFSSLPNVLVEMHFYNCTKWDYFFCTPNWTFKPSLNVVTVQSHYAENHLHFIHKVNTLYDLLSFCHKTNIVVFHILTSLLV